MKKFLTTFSNNTSITIESEDVTSAWEIAMDRVESTNVTITDITEVDNVPITKETNENTKSSVHDYVYSDSNFSDIDLGMLPDNVQEVVSAMGIEGEDLEGIKLLFSGMDNSEDPFTFMLNSVEEHMSLGLTQVIRCELTYAIDVELRLNESGINSAESAKEWYLDKLFKICEQFETILPHRRKMISKIYETLYEEGPEL